MAAIEDGKFKNTKIEFWNDVYSISMTPMRSSVLIEPIVDVVENANIISSISPIFEADLEKITKEELSFVSTFKMQFTRKDLMHGMVGWFEVGFTHCHKPVTLSTSPKYKSTSRGLLHCKECIHSASLNKLYFGQDQLSLGTTPLPPTVSIAFAISLTKFFISSDFKYS